MKALELIEHLKNAVEEVGDVEVKLDLFNAENSTISGVGPCYEFDGAHFKPQCIVIYGSVLDGQAIPEYKGEE